MYGKAVLIGYDVWYGRGLHQQHKLRPALKTQDQVYPWLVAVIWGVIHEESPNLLHKSLRSSMDEIYR